MKHSWMKLSALALVASVGFGCVAQKQYDDLQGLYRKSEEQIAELQARLQEAEARNRALQEAATRSGAQIITVKEADPAVAAERDRLRSELAASNSQVSQLRGQVTALEQKLREAGRIDTVILEPEVDTALRDLARANPDLLSYDPKLGMVRFKSDLTFPLGSTEISKQASDALTRFADIVKRPIASKYEVKIVGNTDNVRIGRPATLQKHPTNWHLSAHRAIAVKDVLAAAGVPQTRIMIGGYGEFRPVVPNGPQGAEANRRVDIYLVPNTYTGPGLPAAQQTPAPKPEIVPDQATAPATLPNK